jgi:hypothetical protein
MAVTTKRTDGAKGTNDATEAERRKRIKAGIAESAMEGNPPPGPEEQAIDDAYIRGGLDARGRTNAILGMLRSDRSPS